VTESPLGRVKKVVKCPCVFRWIKQKGKKKEILLEYQTRSEHVWVVYVLFILCLFARELHVKLGILNEMKEKGRTNYTIPYTTTTTQSTEGWITMHLITCFLLLFFTGIRSSALKKIFLYISHIFIHGQFSNVSDDFIVRLTEFFIIGGGLCLACFSVWVAVNCTHLWELPSLYALEFNLGMLYVLWSLEWKQAYKKQFFLLSFPLLWSFIVSCWVFGPTFFLTSSFSLFCFKGMIRSLGLSVLLVAAWMILQVVSKDLNQLCFACFVSFFQNKLRKQKTKKKQQTE
jgi:hypothetical protein